MWPKEWCFHRVQYRERPARSLHPLPQTHRLQAVPRCLPVPAVSGRGRGHRLHLHHRPQHHEQGITAGVAPGVKVLHQSFNGRSLYVSRFQLEPSSSNLWTSSPLLSLRPYLQPWQPASCTLSGAWSGPASSASAPRESTCVASLTWSASTR